MVELEDGARLWTVTEGEGRPVVWCHGGRGGTDTLAPVASMIADVARLHRYWEAPYFRELLVETAGEKRRDITPGDADSRETRDWFATRTPSQVLRRSQRGLSSDHSS
jgi:hypothetical protein